MKFEISTDSISEVTAGNPKRRVLVKSLFIFCLKKKKLLQQIKAMHLCTNPRRWKNQTRGPLALHDAAVGYTTSSIAASLAELLFPLLCWYV